MSLSCKKIIFLFLVSTLSFFGLSVFAIDVQVTARVPGCGDNIIELSLGEQCEGTNLNNKSCSNLGYDTGVLDCNSACTFDTSDCEYSINGDSKKASKKRLNPNLFGENQTDTVLILSGSASPNSWLIVLNNGEYLHSAPVNQQGIFNTSVMNPQIGRNNLIFYTLDADGVFSKPLEFSVSISSNLVTILEKISIQNFPASEGLAPLQENQDNSEYEKYLIPLIEYFYPGGVTSLLNEDQKKLIKFISEKFNFKSAIDIDNFLLSLKSQNLRGGVYYVYPAICPDYENKKWKEIFSLTSPYAINPVVYNPLPWWKRTLFTLKNFFEL